MDMKISNGCEECGAVGVRFKNGCTRRGTQPPPALHVTHGETLHECAVLLELVLMSVVHRDHEECAGGR